MKIGLDTHPAAPAESYFQHLAKLLSEYAPQHEYVVGGEEGEAFDIYHGFRCEAPAVSRRGRGVTVLTVSDLRFLHDPRLFDLSERLFRLRRYRQALRSAARVIALNASAREELAEGVRVDPRKIEVVMPLGVSAEQASPSEAELEFVRRKYALPEEFVLMVGEIGDRCRQPAVFEALLATGYPAGFVVCGRRTPCSDRLLAFARKRHAAARVDFVYEFEPRELAAFFRLAQAFVHLPEASAGASVAPVVEALRAEVPMVLSDTPVNREAAGPAALYVHPEDSAGLAVALERTLSDERFRREMRDRERHRARLFAGRAVAQRLSEIHAALQRELDSVF